jgi:plasmid maintenance system killer protein
LSNLLANPYEANIGDSENITVTAKNLGTETDSLSVKLWIDGVFIDAQIVQLAAGKSTTVAFAVNTTSEGMHKIKVNTLFGSFRVVPKGMHTLTIAMSPNPTRTVVKVKINGQEHPIPYNELLNEGDYTIAMPAADPSGVHSFLHWENGGTNPTRTIHLTKAMLLVAYYPVGSSCPSLFVWNGTDYVYVAEVSNGGWLGYINYVNEDGSIVFGGGNPWDYVKLDKSQLQSTVNGHYDMTLAQRWNEIFYLDAAYMLVVDHPSDVNVYSTAVRYIDPSFKGQIYTVSKNPLTPVSAVNEKGENVLPQISKLDRIFTPGIDGPNSPSWDNISWNRLTLNLGNLTGAKQIKLIMNGMVDWGLAEDYYRWIDGFLAQKVPNGTQIMPPPYMEVKDANGNWVRVPESRQFPIPAGYVPNTFVADLTGLFPAADYSVRINSFWNVTFDYIGVDTTPQENVTIQRIDPTATLYQVFDTSSSASGNFTRYGDVTPLLLNADDEFVIGRQGDEVSLHFPTANLAPPAEGMERDFFLFVADWFKDTPDNWGFRFGFTVDPLPFQNMSGFPYPLDTESYPYDAAHLAYLQEWNTRVINAPSQPQPQESSLTTWVNAVIMLVAAIDLGVLVYFRKRSR